MRNIFDNCLTDSRYEYNLEEASLSKETGKLTVFVQTNFVVPVEEVERAEGKMAELVPGVSDVEFRFRYRDNVMEPDIFVPLFLKHMIKEVNGKFAHITATIQEENVEVEGNRVTVYVIGNRIAEELNRQLAGRFSHMMGEKLGVEYIFSFVNDERTYCRIKDSIKKSTSVVMGMPPAPERNVEQPMQKKEDTKKDTGKKVSSAAASGSRGKRNDGEKRRTRSTDEPASGNRIIGKSIPASMTEIIPMSQFSELAGECLLEGDIFAVAAKEIRNDRVIMTVLFSDGKSSVCAKSFLSTDKWGEVKGLIKEGDRIRVYGNSEFDTFVNTPVLMIRTLLKVDKPARTDTMEEKRVELHAHTKMSSMDGLSDVKKMIKQAKAWGHKAIAITDHGVVQAFPEAAKAAGGEIKVIYGMEGYLLPDENLIQPDGTIDYKNKKSRTNHIILLAATQEGLKNLYKLVSLSHLEYFYKRPRIPKSLLAANREGIIIGSACEAGEIFRAILDGRSDEELDRLAEFYDYFEIQPLINNRFLINKGIVEDRQGLIDLNMKVIELADRHGKPVVATCDAHYINEDDYVFRKILMAGQGYTDLGEGGLYLRTTDEMYEEFDYLDRETAKKIIVDNPNMIADMIDDIRPVPKGKFPPHIDNADNILREECYRKAHEMYGDPLPELIEKRLADELRAIIDEGYAVMYVSAQMLVRKSMSDGYLVGSRGSVGSSFAATMAGITEVNPLPPHYLCPECKYIEWGDENEYDCGVDMPEKVCPVCGCKLRQEGFTIPFETFLGIPGKQKEPDIDLNFAGEYQPVAHKYVDEIFGAKNVFKAGTIGTIATKTAYGFVLKYFEERGIPVNKYETERLAMGCEGVKRTTGQHPGGIIIMPEGHEIYEFCPVQRPANDMSSDFITTHFDYHAIDENLLKLDILGHDAPSIIRHLQDMTGVDPIKDVPLKDAKVNSIFLGTEALEIKDEDYRFRHGSYGIPEFGTKFVRQMLDDTHPEKFADLVRISGFSHGTDVWLGNAKDYIKDGTATMQNAISTRDDIMNYLILKGVPPIPAFTIMEKVRKGKGVTDEEAALMLEHGTPQWYVDSCRKIKYMFPRAHAVAYVTMAYRIAWFKVYYPQAFYAAHLTTKIADFNWDVIRKGKHAVLTRMDELLAKGKSATTKEEGEILVLEICYEMMARGYEFMPPSFESSEAVRFTVKDGKVVVPVNAMPGVGENCAKMIMEEYSIRPFETVEEIQIRAKANRTAIAALRENGMLDGMQETDQMSFF